MSYPSSWLMVSGGWQPRVFGLFKKDVYDHKPLFFFFLNCSELENYT